MSLGLNELMFDLCCTMSVLHREITDHGIRRPECINEKLYEITNVYLNILFFKHCSTWKLEHVSTEQGWCSLCVGEMLFSTKSISKNDQQCCKGQSEWITKVTVWLGLNFHSRLHTNTCILNQRNMQSCTPHHYNYKINYFNLKSCL